MSPEPDFMKRLEEELSSCQLQTVNPAEATTDEIVKDLHKILAGNGGPTRGLIVKVAAANVNLDVLKERVDRLQNDMGTQRDICADYRNKAKIAAAKAEGKLAKGVLGAMWQLRAPILMLLIGGVLYFSTGWKIKAQSQAQLNSVLPQIQQMMSANMVNQVEKLLDMKLTAIKEADDAKDNNSGTASGQ